MNSEKSQKASLWKTAYAKRACAEFEKGFVSVNYRFTDEQGTDWFAINKSERGETRVTVIYPDYNLSDFCL
jgi:predicted GNAT superfamily acetyltransferase